MEIKFVFDINAPQVTWDDIDTFSYVKRGERDKIDSIRMHDLLAKYLVDENGQYVDPERAHEILGKLTVSQIQEATSKFMEAVKIAAVPLPREIPSPLPSEVEPADSLSPAGSQH